MSKIHHYEHDLLSEYGRVFYPYQRTFILVGTMHQWNGHVCEETPSQLVLGLMISDVVGT